MAKQEITDFGEHIGGARKDLWKSRGFKIEDLDDLTLKEYVETVTKENIWVTPDYTALCNKMPAYCAYFVRHVREKIKAKTIVCGDSKDRERAENYINFINTVKDMCYAIRTDDDILNFSDRFRQKYSDSRGYWLRICSETPGIDNNFIWSLKITKSGLEQLKIECEIQGFPEKFRGDLKGITVRKVQRNGESKYILVSSRSQTVSKLMMGKTFNTVEEAVAYGKTQLHEDLDNNKKTKKVSELVNVVRPQLEFIERVGPNIRKGNNATGDSLIESFGFRGGEFGNWNTQDDRQAYLNYAFDAFADLAFVLDIPIDFISLGN